MKARVVIGAILAALVAIGLYWFTRGGGDDARPRVGSAETAASMSPAPAGAMTSDARTQIAAAHAKHTEAERKALIEAIATARSRRTAKPSAPIATGAPGATGTPDTAATTLDILDRTGDTSAWEKRTLGVLNSLLGECYDLGRAESPKLEGTIKLRFTLAGEPGVGGVLERVEIVDEGTSITQQTIRDCMIQQLYALELDPPPEGMRVEREVSLKFP
jgi:hypothetical protein